MIPDEAVEAAAKRIASHYGTGENNWEWYLTEAAEVLEAAAPYMLAQAWDEGASWASSDSAYWPDDNPYRSKP